MKWKRFIGIILCACMVTGLFYPTEQVSAEETTNTDTTETTVNGGTPVVYYEDDFGDDIAEDSEDYVVPESETSVDDTSATNYITALGSFADTDRLKVINGRLENLYATSSKPYQRFASFNSLNVQANYSVSTDVTIGTALRFAAVCAYANEDGQGYEFGIIGNNAGPFFRILNRAESNAVIVGAKNTTAVSKWFETYAAGNEITLRIDASTDADGVVNLKCYATYQEVEKLIFDCKSDNASCSSDIDIDFTVKNESMTLKKGVPCLVSSDDTGYFSYVSVKSLDNVDTSTVTLPYVEDFDGDSANMAAQWNNGNMVKLEEDTNGNRQAVLATRYPDYTPFDTHVSKMYLTGVSASATWTNYVYEADVTLTDQEILENGKTQASGIAAIVGAVQGVEGDDGAVTYKGYEFGLMYHHTNKTYKVRLYDRNDGTPNTSKTYSFSLNETVRLKMIISGHTITCYVNGEQVIQHVDSDTTKQFTGTVGIIAQGSAAKFDNLVVSSAADYYNLEKYRSDADNYTHPSKCGHVFGGWYTDSAYENPLATDVTTGCAYAKWVAEEVLSVKAQLSADGADDSGRVMMRLVSTADCDDYIDHGFYVETINSNKEFDAEDLLSSIQSRYAGIEVNYTPSGAFHETSTLFSTIILKNLKATNDGTTDHLNKDFIIKPFWVTADGTKVYGVTRVLTIQEGLDAMGQTEPVVPFSL